MTNKNAQRLEDCIVVLKAGRSSIGDLAAMIAAKSIIDVAIAEHEKWELDQKPKEMYKKEDDTQKAIA